jgi:hypothetical protein
LEEVSEGDAPLLEVAPALVSDEPPTLTRSVLFRSVGVPDLDNGRSRSDAVGRVGSELFCVISSRKARTSAASPGVAVIGGVAAATAAVAVVESTPAGRESGESESRSSRIRSASCFLDFDLVPIGTVTMIFYFAVCKCVKNKAVNT